MQRLLQIIFILFIACQVKAQNNLDAFFNTTEEFLQTYVIDGKVNYGAIVENPVKLNDLYKLAGEVNLKEVSADVYKAFWINAYNLGVIKGVVDHYPIRSVMKIRDFFQGRENYFAGESIDLNTIENKKLKGDYEDARYHFVLVCGALGCPPLSNYAFRPHTLNAQLNMLTKKAMNNPQFIRFQPDEVKLSQIFKWYKKEFDAEGGAIAFINKYRDEGIASNTSVSYYAYDWKLNILPEGLDQAGDPMKKKSNILEFTPSKLMKKGQWDMKWFNNLYTQTRFVDGDEVVQENQPRESFFTSTFEVYTGLDSKGKFNLGLVANLKSNVRSDLTNAFSAIETLKFGNDEVHSRAGLTSIAPTIKFAPFAGVNFTVQSGLAIPLLSEESLNGVFLDKKSFTWDNRFYFDHTFPGNKFQIFSEVDLAYYFGKEGEGYANNSLGIPVSLFLSYFPADKFTIYVNGQHFQLIELSNSFSQDYTLVGLGAKYQLTEELNLELSSSYFVRASAFTGLGETYNLGLRYIL